MIRPIWLFGLISCICFGADLSKFKRAQGLDGRLCIQNVFNKTFNTLATCARLCTLRTECGHFHVTSGNGNGLCVVCSSTEPHTPGENSSMAYVLGEQMTYIGCYNDYSNDRQLNGLPPLEAPNSPYYGLRVMVSATMTNEMCLQYCREQGFIYSGTQYYEVCFCANNFQEDGNAPESDCDTACKGDPTQMCGGGMRNAIYT